jgi:hypothetical protein
MTNAPASSLSSPPLVLSEPDWQKRRARHEERLRPWAEAETSRASRGEKHPIYDFLFDYYRFRPSHLLRWHPGLGSLLAGPGARDYLQYREYREWPEGVGADPAALPPHRLDSVGWILTLLQGTRDRPAMFGCFGLHEWAMVYRTPEVRHGQLPLRLSPEAIADFVESSSIRCTHYDAFRFFTPPARPLNRFQPAKETQLHLEQKGCLHANMDLYKWAHKLSPYVPSDLVADAFLLALRIRELDMRASPYDVRSLGFDPVAIETREGRAEYERLQRAFSAEAEPIREGLIAVCRGILQR